MRLFVAAWLPADVVDGIARLARPDRKGVRWTTPDQWHVTLRFLGSVDDTEEVKGVLLPLSVPGPLVARAGPAVARLGPSILCLPVHGLEPLAAAVVDATARLGEPPEDRPFRGHVTLARGRRGVDLRSLAGEAFTATWPVDDVTLVASDTRPDRAHYSVVARYPISTV